MEMAVQFYEARALHILAEARIADIFAEGNHEAGVHIDEVSRQTGIKAHKLGEYPFLSTLFFLC